MLLISHRGNINGKSENLENNPEYIDVALSKGYDVEIDLWFYNNTLYLGHDLPTYVIDNEWLNKRKKNLWVHCKNIESVLFFKSLDDEFNYFWHQEDDITLTSLNYIWAYPGKQPIKDSIAVLPEINDDDVSICYGICSDYLQNYTK